MTRYILAGLIVLCAIVIAVSFFLPWARASVSVTKAARTLTGAAASTLQKTPFAGRLVTGLNRATSAITGLGDVEVKAAVSGYDIPILVNKRSSRIALSLIQIMVKSTEGLAVKSMLVWLIPLLAIGCAMLAVTGLAARMAIIGIAVISGAVSLPGLYNLMTANLSSDTLPVRISIENGLWQTMYGYLVMFILSIIWFAIDRKRR